MAKPVVAIVGRPNVGKSMLFNKLTGRRTAIVEDTPGVTRDRIYGLCDWNGRTFDLIDTGGIEPSTDSQMLLFMRRQAEIAIEVADVIIMVTDVRVGMTAADLQAYSQAHRYQVVFVDYLQKIAVPRGSRATDYERVSQISSALQQFGRITGTTVVALSQLSRPDRDAKSRKIRPPALSDLRSSGQIEQDADVVLFLYREDYDDKQSNRLLRIAKNKEGEAMDYVRFAFDGDKQTFSRIAPRPDPPAGKGKKEPDAQTSFWPADMDPNDPWSSLAQG